MKKLDDILPEDFVKLREQKYELEELQKRGPTYWDFLGELMFFGTFEATRAVLDDYITIEQGKTLLESAKRSYYGTVYDSAVASLAGAAGVHKGSAFDATVKFYKREML